MADVYSIEKTTLTAIANELRAKIAETDENIEIDELSPADIAAAIHDLNAFGMPIPTDTLPITENGKYDVTKYAEADVSLPLEDQTATGNTITANGTYEPSDGYEGFSKVKVNVPIPYNYYQRREATLSIKNIGVPYSTMYGQTETFYRHVRADIPLEDKTITANGTYEPSDEDEYEGFSKVTVKVPTHVRVDGSYTIKLDVTKSYTAPPVPSDAVTNYFFPLWYDSEGPTNEPIQGLSFKTDGRIYGIVDGDISAWLLYSPDTGWIHPDSTIQVPNPLTLKTRYNGVIISFELWNWFKLHEYKN